MNEPAPLWRLTLRTTLAAEEPVAAVLESVYHQPACVCWDAQRQINTISVYLGARAAAHRPSRDSLLHHLRDLRDAGLQVGPGRPTLRRVPARDWAESWKRHFPPFRAGNLWVRPSWSKRRRPAGTQQITIDPGLSFGTGQHPTTRFCLEQLVARRESGAPQGLLDIGTGSGILAIAAARIGYAPVVGLDIDRSCIATARQNARLNRLKPAIRFRTSDIARWDESRRRFSVICANLTADLLTQNVSRIRRRLEPRGSLLLAGILREEAAPVAAVFAAAGLLQQCRRDEAEWTCLSFLRPALRALRPFRATPSPDNAG